MDFELRRLQRAAKENSDPKNLATLLAALARFESYSEMDHIAAQYSNWKAPKIIEAASSLAVLQALATGRPNMLSRFWTEFKALGLEQLYSYLSFMPSGGIRGEPVLAIFFECFGIALSEDQTETYWNTGQIADTRERLQRIHAANFGLANALNELEVTRGDALWRPQPVHLSDGWDSTHDFIIAEHPVTPKLLYNLFIT